MSNTEERLSTSRALFRKVFPLTTRQPWLTELQSQLEALLFEDCKNDEQTDLIIELLDRFYYLDSSDFQKKLNELAEAIVTDADLTDEKTIIAAMAANSSTDSSELILYSLKPLLEKNEWREYLNVNRYDHITKKVKSSPETYDHIVLVDEFIGSGDTVLNRVRTLKAKFEEMKLPNYPIRVKVIAATELGLRNVKQEGINVETLVTIKKGISDYFDDPNIPIMLNHMTDIEDCLSLNYKDRALPSLGYNQAEALYARADGNTPNSVFPVFWWRFYKNGQKRETLLNRAMGDA